MTNAYRCKNCGTYVDTRFEDFCSRQCELEAQYTEQCMCRACGGTGRGRHDNLKGEWVSCRKCSGSGYVEP